MLKNDLLIPNQSGYKQYHSCETALLEVVNNIQQFIQNHNLTAEVMLDLSAAFGTVDHNCLFVQVKKQLWNNRQCVTVAFFIFK